MRVIDMDKLSSRLGGDGLAGTAMAQMAEAAKPVPARTLEVIGSEIREHTAALEYHARASIWEAVEIGRRLDEARGIARHGEWGPFLEQVGLNEQKAQRLMRVYREYGERQKSIFGTGLSNPSALTGLSYTKAFMLLAIADEEEREEFIEVHDVEGMSTRELQEALRARDEAVKAAAESESAAVKAEERAKFAEKRVEKLSTELEEAESAAEQLRADVEAVEAQKLRAEQEAETARKAAAEAQAEVSSAEAEAEALRNQVRELEARPVEVAVKEIDSEALDKARAEAVADMQAKLDRAKEKAAQAEEKRKTAEDALAEANAKLESAKRQQAEATIAGDRELTTFELMFSQVQESVNRMHGVLLKVRDRDADLGAKLRTALIALADKIREAAEA